MNEYERKIFKEENKEKKEKNNFMNIKSNDSTNVAFRKKESVIDGNEFSEFNKNDIKWD